MIFADLNVRWGILRSHAGKQYVFAGGFEEIFRDLVRAHWECDHRRCPALVRPQHAPVF